MSASELNTIIVADSVNGKISFSFGPPKPKKRILQDFSYKTTRNLGEFYRQKSQGREECREQYSSNEEKASLLSKIANFFTN